MSRRREEIPLHVIDRFARALDGFVRALTGEEYRLLEPDAQATPAAVVAEVRALLASLQLSSDPLVQAVVAHEVQRSRQLRHPDESGRVTALRLLYALDRQLAGLAPEGPQPARIHRKRSRGDVT